MTYDLALSACFPHLGQSLSLIPGICEPVDVHVAGRLDSGVSLFIQDAQPVASLEIANHFRYRLSPALVERIDRSGEFTRRPLLDANFRQISEEILYLDLLQTHGAFHGKGMGRAFYRQLLSAARYLGFKFVGQRHIDQAALDFFVKRGCLRSEEAPSHLRPHFELMEEEDPAVPGWQGLYTMYIL